MAVQIKNIYKGSTFVGDTGTGITLPAVVDTTKTIVLGSWKYHYSDDPSDHYRPGVMRLVNSTTITVEKLTSGEDVTVNWMVIEFESGVTTQHLHSTSGDTVQDRDVTISAVTLSRSWCVGARRMGSAYYNPSKTDYCYLSSTTNARMRSPASASDNGYTIQVIDYEGATVQGGVKTLSSTTDTVTISSATDANTLIFCSQHAGGASQVGQWDLQNATTLRSRRGSSTSRDAYYQVVEIPEVTVQRGYAAMSSSETSDNITVSAVSELTYALGIIMPNAPYPLGDVGTNNCDGMFIRGRLTTTTNFQADRVATQSQQADYVWTVLEWTSALPTELLLDFEDYSTGNLTGQDSWERYVAHGANDDIQVVDAASTRCVRGGANDVAAVRKENMPILTDKAIEIKWRWQVTEATAKMAIGPALTSGQGGDGGWNDFRVRVLIEEDHFNCKGTGWASTTGWPTLSEDTWYFMRLVYDDDAGTYDLFYDTSAARTSETQLVNGDACPTGGDRCLLLKNNSGSAANYALIDDIEWAEESAPPAVDKLDHIIERGIARGIERGIE